MNDTIDRSWHPNFKDYTEQIVAHPNYKGLFYERGENGNVKWVVTGQSLQGKKRKQWWDEQCRRHSIPIEKGCYATIARLIHPTGKKVCQCCGKSLSIYYEYPNKSLLKKINQHFSIDFQCADFTIREIIETYCQSREDIAFFSTVFNFQYGVNSQNIECCKSKLIEHIYTHYVDKCSRLLSPGAMSNSPDRFDGFHSDGLCCREKTDKGRHTDNMKTYTQDRRAYEEWADGDFNLANRLMGEFAKGDQKYKCPQCGNMERMSADHIGPISLGFAHSVKNFTPLCKHCNSAKNNRITYQNVQTLLSREIADEQVISWHAKYIWDRLKSEVHNDDDAKLLSSVMLKCHQNVLFLFAQIYSETGDEFLRRYLHPEYAKFDYRFDNFNPLHLEQVIIKKTPLDSANKRSNQERYVRVAFGSLADFQEKDNRKTTFVIGMFDKEMRTLIDTIHAKNYPKADEQLKALIQKISIAIEKKEWKH